MEATRSDGLQTLLLIQLLLTGSPPEKTNSFCTTVCHCGSGRLVYRSLHTVSHCSLTLLQKTYQHSFTLTVLFRIQDSKILFAISHFKAVIMDAQYKESIKRRIEKVAGGS